MRISDWSSDVCSSDLRPDCSRDRPSGNSVVRTGVHRRDPARLAVLSPSRPTRYHPTERPGFRRLRILGGARDHSWGSYWLRSLLQHRLLPAESRSEEHTSELQSLMRISYAVFFLKKKK